MVSEGKRIIQTSSGVQEFDFTDYRKVYTEVLSFIRSHKLFGIAYVLGRIFDDIGFNQIEDPPFMHLVLYRLVYPKSILKTTEYLYRYEQASYSEDDVYRYMDKLHST